MSDSDLEELHAFAAANGIPRRGFDRDHYDVPEEAHARLVAAGAEHVDGHELVRRLIASGLRVTAQGAPRRSLTAVRVSSSVGACAPPACRSARPS